MEAYLDFSTPAGVATRAPFGARRHLAKLLLRNNIVPQDDVKPEKIEGSVVTRSEGARCTTEIRSVTVKCEFGYAVFIEIYGSEASCHTASGVSFKVARGVLDLR
jgi:hypothetical protein